MSSKSSRTERPRSLPETVEVGRIRRPHGVHGALLIEPESDVPTRFSPGSRLLLEGPGAQLRPITVRSSSAHRGGLLVEFDELTDRDAVESLRGRRLQVPLDQVPPRPAQGWYHFELLDCRCHDKRGGELGTVVAVLEDGGGTMLRVEQEERGVLIPFVQAFITAVDVEAGTIELDLPEGFLETCAYRS